MLRRSDTFQLVCCFYASLLPISKGETVKWTLLQIDNFFQFSDKKAIWLTRTQRKILGIPRDRELNWTFLLIFPKRNIYYTSKQQWFYLISFYTFEGVRYFWVKLCFFFSKLPSATNQQLFCVTENDIGQGPLNHTPPLYELLASILWLTLSFGEVSKTCREMH